AAKKRLTKEDKKILEQRRKLEGSYPPDLVACLQTTTDWLRQLGWSQPPGSERVFYWRWRRTSALEVGAPKVRQKTVTAPPVEAMLLSMATASGNDHALPSVIRTLPQAELLHRALVKAACRHGDTPSAVLTGRDESGKPLTEPHRHAHLLPLDLDDDGHLDHILIWAPMLLDASAQAAVRAVRTTFTKGGVGPLRLALVGSGSLAELRGLAGAYGEKLRDLIAPSSGTTEWTSVTPFVPPRYLKKRGKNTLEGQVIAELVTRGHPEPTAISVLDPRSDARLLRMRHFFRSRRQGQAAPVDIGFSVSLQFAKPIMGPLCLGYGCHFGLGTFTAIKSNAP
ncbi:MAG TPA: type I-U CRISPR-associated protein Csb2, partial [Burkholderiales bacterium]|nr:type I-U CRISPR-associated protein Csb2 [Burkholderiales bacterium]